MNNSALMKMAINLLVDNDILDEQTAQKAEPFGPMGFVAGDRYYDFTDLVFKTPLNAAMITSTIHNAKWFKGGNDGYVSWNIADLIDGQNKKNRKA